MVTKNLSQSSCTYYVSGMHCGACEILLQKEIGKVKGVKKVDASLQKNSITISSDHANPSLEQLNRVVKKLGYTISDKPLERMKMDSMSFLQAIVVIIIGGLAYMLLEDSGILMRYSLTSSSSIGTFFVVGIIASLSSCAALVGGVLLTVTGKSSSINPHLSFHVGRLLSFALFGALLGIIGSFLQISLSVTAVLIILVSILMIIVALQLLGVPYISSIRLGFPRFITQFASDETKIKGKMMPFISGALTFFLPCGFTLMAQTTAILAGNPVTSALMMIAFALGTLPVLVLMSISSIKFGGNSSYAPAFNLIVALALLVFGVSNINAQLNVLNLPSLSNMSSPSETIKEEANSLGVLQKGEGENAYQEVTMEAREFEYFPSSLKLKADVPVKLTVNNFDVVGCAQAMWLGGLYDKVVYLNTPKSTAEFTPEKGSYKISCTMGMVRPVMVTVE